MVVKPIDILLVKTSQMGSGTRVIAGTKHFEAKVKIVEGLEDEFVIFYVYF